MIRRILIILIMIAVTMPSRFLRAVIAVLLRNRRRRIQILGSRL